MVLEQLELQICLDRRTFCSVIVDNLQLNIFINTYSVIVQK